MLAILQLTQQYSEVTVQTSDVNRLTSNGAESNLTTPTGSKHESVGPVVFYRAEVSAIGDICGGPRSAEIVGSRCRGAAMSKTTSVAGRQPQ